MARLHCIKRRHCQRGVVSIWFALMLTVLMCIVALAVDLARLQLAKAELQNAADAAALAGAGSLIDPTKAGTFQWQAARDKATEFAGVNTVDGMTIAQNQNASVQIESNNSYWNINNRDGSVQTITTTVPNGYLPAVHATISLAHLKLFFANFLGISESNLQASATAVVAPPMGGTGMFPFTIGMATFGKYWDSVNKVAKGGSFEVHLESYYTSGEVTGGIGTWTSLTQAIGGGSNDTPTIGGIITAGGNTIPMYIGDPIWVSNGNMDVLYKNKQYPLPIGKPIGIPVIQDVSPGNWTPIIAIAGFVIDSSNSQGKEKYISGHFIDAATVAGLTVGSGTGQQLGAYTPPFLVQ
jgi:Flp pilus assembly protein TadG